MVDAGPSIHRADREGQGQEPAALLTTCNIHRDKNPPSYHWLSVLLQASATAPSMEPDPGMVSHKWDVFAAPG